MTYRAALGAARPTWCPPTTFDPNNPRRDPCEIQYRMDLPVVGEVDIGLPVSQITNDAINTVRQQLPQLYADVLPYIQQVKADVIADAEYIVPEFVKQVLDEVVEPELDTRMATLKAEASMWGQTLLLGLGLISAGSITAWYFLRK